MALKEEVLGVMAKILNAKKEELIEDKRLYDSLGVDSTEMVELAIALSKHFSIKIETKEISKFSTPLDIIKLIEKKKQNADN